MPDIPAPGTWVRLTHRGDPAGSWHHVVGWHPEARRLQLRCASRDRNISWALEGVGPWAVARSTKRPDEQACGTCRFREVHATHGHGRSADASTPTAGEASPDAPRLRRIGRNAWVLMTAGPSQALTGR